MLELDTPVLTIAEASTVAGVNPGTARSWVQKKWMSFHEDDEKARVPGATTLVNARTVLALTIASRLVGQGVHPQAACGAARQFTDQSDPLEAPGHEREPGCLFPGRVHTALAVYPIGAAVVRVEEGPSPTPFQQLFVPIDPAAALFGRQEVATVLLLDFVVKHVEVELGKLVAA